MPKKQHTAAQKARNDARSGTKYTEALRARTDETDAPQGAHVVRFLAERSGNLFPLVGGIAAAWAHNGQRVLLLEEANDHWMWNFRHPGRSRRKQEPPAPPEPKTTTLWTSPSCPGALVVHTCLWETRGQTKEGNRGFPQRDRGPLQAAVSDARGAYDVIVILPQGGWAYPDREMATAHAVLAEVHDFPHTDCRVVLPGTLEDRGIPLNPEQSAAVLRERCLSFLFGSPHLPVLLDGVVWQSNRTLPVDAAYLAGIDRDMTRAGLRTLGWTTQRSLTSHRELPEPARLQDPEFVQPYRQIATRLRTALDSRPARNRADMLPTAPQDRIAGSRAATGSTLPA
ncbi:hypothetical protein [Streptomyces jumonjinensis]|uniref:hypothetical protein n=1 Tax=Streptomyces jumonjinensis TaxID=1945 RepID=UPI0018867367|nr:hypothetical protein [Streptomyces jumonjinensis]